MASSLQGLLEKQSCRWSPCKKFAVFSAFALLGLTMECGPAKAQGTSGHPPVISTTTQWTLDAPKLAATTASGTPGNSYSLHANFSPDGTHLLFWSGSTNLVPGAANGYMQLYMKDLVTGAITVVSKNANGVTGSGPSSNPNNSCQVRMFSPDGAKVVFESAAMNLVPGGTNGFEQVFIKDTTAGTVTLVSADANGNQGNGNSLDFSFSPDGTRVVFDTFANNLLAGVNSSGQVLAKDLGTNTVTLVSSASNGNPGNGVSSWPVLSSDGTEVAFVSTSTNLTSVIVNGTSRIYVKNLLSGVVTLVSADANGVPGNGASLYPMFSPDGGKVAFDSVSTNLVPGQTNGNSEVYVKDLATGEITLVSTDANGNAANSNNSILPVFSPDGTKIAFESAATNLVPGGTNGFEQVFVKDLLAGGVTLASTDAGGTQGNNSSSDPNFSPDYMALAFQSAATNIGVTNGTTVVFERPIFTASGAVVDNPSATTLTTTGQLAFSDADTGDTHTASVTAQAGDLGAVVASVTKDTTGTGTGGVIHWNYQVNEGSVHGLSASATDTFTLTLTDSQGCTATTAIVVTALPHDFRVVNASSGSGSGSTSTSSCPTIVATTTAVASSLNPSVFGQAVTFTATVSDSASGVAAAPTGAVQFVVDGVNFGTPVALTGTSSNSRTATSQGMATLSVAGSPHTVTANYLNADGKFSNSSATLAGGQTVMAARTTMAVTSSQNPSVFSQSVTFTATVSPVAPGVGTPTGTVTFLDGGSPIGTATLSAGQATFTTAALAVGSHTITTSYGGDASFNGSKGSLTGNSQLVNKANTATAVTSWENPTVFGQAVTFNVGVSSTAGTPTGTVTFLDGTTSIGSGTLDSWGWTSFTSSSLAVRTHTITASYGGASSFSSSSSSPLSQTVNQDAATVALNSSVNPSVFGQGVPFTVMVMATAPGAGTPTGKVTLQDGTTALATVNLANGQASLNLPTLAVGSHSITAVYKGDSNFTTASSAALSETVNKDASSLTLSSSVNPSVFGQPVVVTATVSAVAPGAGTPTGAVTFQDGTTTLGTLNLANGQASLTVPSLAVGSHSITAVYNGDGNFTAASSAALSETVNKAASSTKLSSSANPSVYGQSVTFTATVSPVAPGAGTPTGTVTFSDGGSSIGTATLSGGQATFTASALAVGNHTITTSYAGDASFNGSTGTLTGTPQVVNKANTATAVTSSQNPSVYGQSVTFTATVSPVAPGAGTPTGTVTFSDGGSSIGTATLSAGQATFTTSALAVGSHTITTSYAGDASFNGSKGTLTRNPQVVNKANTATAVTSSQNPSVYGQSVTFTATVSPVAPGAGTPTGTVTFLDGGSSIGTATLSAGQATFTTSALAVGSHAITTSYAGNANFNGSTGTLTGNSQVVNKANTTTAVTSSQNPSVLGQSVTFTATVSPVAPGAGTPTGTVTFNDGATVLATAPLSSTGTATFSTSALVVKSHTITAVYSGDANFNGSSGSLTQNVQYSIHALYDPSKWVHSGATFPVKIQLCDFAGNDVSAPSIIVHATEVTGASGSSWTPRAAGNANPNNNFRYDGGLGPRGGYIFNLKTNGLKAGTYNLQFSVAGDPVLHAVTFEVN